LQWRFLDRLSSAAERAMEIALAPFGKVTLEVLLERDLAVPVEPISAQIPVAIREADEADLDRITLLYAHDSYLYLGDELAAQSRAGVQTIELEAREQYRDRMRRGEKCFLAFVGDEIAHVNWLCLSWAEAAPGHPIYLQAGEVYTTDAITPDKFRGKNIHALVLGEMLRHAQRLGRRRAYTVTRSSRRATFGGLRQLKWRIAGMALCFIPRGTNKSRLFRIYGRVDPLFRSAPDAVPRIP
jgi:hypothetical protein